MSALTTQPAEVQNFSLGITDYYIDGSPMAAKQLDNLEITNNKKPRTRPGCIVVNDQLSLGLFRINKLSEVKYNLIGFQDKKAYHDVAGTWTEIVGPNSGTFMPAGNSSSVITSAEWQEQTFYASDSYCSPQKLFINNLGTYSVRNAGLPSLPSNPLFTYTSGAVNSYLYAFCFTYEYQVGSVTYLDRGPVLYYATKIETAAPIDAGNTVTITLPGVLATPENWDITSNKFKVEIYRTTDVGTVYYKLGDVIFGATNFVDNFTDAVITANETIYTTGGVYSNDTPPLAKFVHIVNDYGYWANIKTGAEYVTTEIRQSKTGDPDSVPATFNAYTEQPITGLSSIFDKPIVLCEKYIYRIDNFIADDGSGTMLLRRIDDNAGCISAQSIVQTPVGLFWAGRHGFFWTDGFRVVNISLHLNKATYPKLVMSEAQQKKICGTYDPNTQRVYWTVSLNNTVVENNRVLVLDLKFPFMPSDTDTGGCFTTWNGDNLAPTQVFNIGNYIYRGDSKGYIYKHGIEYVTDPKLDLTKAASLWGTQTIIHTYESCCVDFGSKFYRKWVPRILVSADNSTNLSLAIHSSNDNNRVQGDLKPIIYRNSIQWGDNLPVWDDPTAQWNAQGLIEEWRRFPAGGLRCNYKQITFTNALIKLVDSDLLGTATINPIAKSATLGGSFTWLSDIADYFLYFENDNYTRSFKVLSQTPTTVIYEDIGSNSPVAGTYKWVLKGKPKGEILTLNGFVVHFAMISKSHTPFSSASVGGNPA